MCGILGLATTRNDRLSLDERAICRLRDTLTRRGPDDAGLWMNGHIALAHRRLAIIDPEHGSQPMAIALTPTPAPAPGTHDAGSEDHFLITYNGEIYNHRELRRELIELGHRFETNCDTETVVRAYAQWGVQSFDRFRGMFALAIYQPATHTLTLARDSLGIKPLYYATVNTPQGREFIFASEPIAILAHPHFDRRPDWAVVSSYLTTIRTTLGSRSFFAGLHVVQPGEMIRIDLSGKEIGIKIGRWYEDHAAPTPTSFPQAIDDLRSLIEHSVEAHLLSDVPTCALLSGGLDSSIITSLACDHLDELDTYCAGALLLGDTNNDFVHARTMARQLGTNHHDVAVRMKEFQECWPWMISQLGVPLSTPNEVAIYTVARKLAERAKVTLSGEGADEFFAGYEVPVRRAVDFFSTYEGDSRAAAEFTIGTQAWIPMEDKAVILREEIMEFAGHDEDLQSSLALAFIDADDRESGLRAFLRTQQDFNLTGLLSRLDTATMLASVEGRTPLADRVIAQFARSMPFEYLWTEHDDDQKDRESASGGTSLATQTATTSKRILRHAFADRLPPEIVHRPKASFPLPFRFWMDSHVDVLQRCAMAREVFTEKSITTICENPAGNWGAAWPMLNLAMWFESQWG